MSTPDNTPARSRRDSQNANPSPALLRLSSLEQLGSLMNLSNLAQSVNALDAITQTDPAPQQATDSPLPPSSGPTPSMRGGGDSQQSNDEEHPEQSFNLQPQGSRMNQRSRNARRRSITSAVLDAAGSRLDSLYPPGDPRRSATPGSLDVPQSLLPAASHLMSVAEQGRQLQAQRIQVAQAQGPLQHAHRNPAQQAYPQQVHYMYQQQYEQQNSNPYQQLNDAYQQHLASANPQLQHYQYPHPPSGQAVGPYPWQQQHPYPPQFYQPGLQPDWTRQYPQTQRHFNQFTPHYTGPYQQPVTSALSPSTSTMQAYHPSNVAAGMHHSQSQSQRPEEL